MIKEHREFLIEFMADEENAEWARKRRITFLRERLKELILAYAPPINLSKTDKWMRELIEEEMKKIKKKIAIIIAEIRLWNKPKFTDDKITDEMIESAKEYPIENLIEINKRGFAKCIWHDDKNPSMYCKSNYAYCFSCGKSGSVIDIYRELHNCSFKDALKALQN